MRGPWEVVATYVSSSSMTDVSAPGPSDWRRAVHEISTTNTLCAFAFGFGKDDAGFYGFGAGLGPARRRPRRQSFGQHLQLLIDGGQGGHQSELGPGASGGGLLWVVQR